MLQEAGEGEQDLELDLLQQFLVYIASKDYIKAIPVAHESIRV